MILTCPSCRTRYRADPANFSAPGRNVRCAKCGNIWFQPPPEPELPSAPESAAFGNGTNLPDGAASSPGYGEQKLIAGPAGHGKTADWQRWFRDAGWKPAGIVVLVLIVAVSGWAAEHYRQAVVRLWPEAARFYSAVGVPVNTGSVAIRDVGVRQENQEGTRVLSVTGRLVNVTDHDQRIPRLSVVLLDHTKRELYRWTFDPGFASLAAGAERDFGTQLPNPPPDAQSVNVNFAPDDGQ